MKFKTTQKEIKNEYNTIIKVGYDEVQNLLNYKDAMAYTCGSYGWKSDIYDLGDGIALSTGYQPFGNVSPDWEMIKKYDNEAIKINCNKSIKWEDKENKINKLIEQFKKEIKGE